MKTRLLCALFIFSLSLPIPPVTWGQTQSPATNREQDQKISLKTAEVVLDAVVKDKKGRVVKDLGAADFEVYEDGVRQQIESFRLVTRKTANNANGNAAAVPDKSSSPARLPETDKPTNLAAGETEAGVSAIALVFDRLSPDARKRARDTALNYVGEGTRPDDFIGVFNIDLSLKVLQNYTTENKLVRQAIERAGTSASATFTSHAEEARSQNQRIEDLQKQAASAAASASAGGYSNL